MLSLTWTPDPSVRCLNDSCWMEYQFKIAINGTTCQTCRATMTKSKLPSGLSLLCLECHFFPFALLSHGHKYRCVSPPSYCKKMKPKKKNPEYTSSHPMLQMGFLASLLGGWSSSIKFLPIHLFGFIASRIQLTVIMLSPLLWHKK